MNQFDEQFWLKLIDYIIINRERSLKIKNIYLM